MSDQKISEAKTSVSRAIIICALGYFMDVFDYNLLTVLRVASLNDLGIAPDVQAAVAGYIVDAQLGGILFGALLWGFLGDRFGRVRALYGSIFIYSLATLACSFVHDPVTYGVLRFLAGAGIAGEVGVATTLIVEITDKTKRGWAGAILAGVGCSGPVAAVAISWFLDWRTVYLVAGIAGFVLLVLRMKLLEPALFTKISCNRHLGSLKLLMRTQPILILASCIILAAVGTYGNWFLNFFSLELSRSVIAGNEVFNQKTALLLFYIGLGLGDVGAFVASQLLASRRKVLFGLWLINAVTALSYLLIGPIIKLSADMIYAVYLILGLGGGIWSLAIMVGAEQFGTNIRATSATLVCNMARVTIIPVLLVFQNLKGVIGLPNTAAAIGMVFYILAFIAILNLRETHGLDLDYVEKLEKPI